MFRPFQYDAQVKAGTSVAVCPDWKDESVSRIIMTELLLAGV